MNFASPFQVRKTSGAIHSAQITVQTHTLSNLAIPHPHLLPSLLFEHAVTCKAIWESSRDQFTLIATSGCLSVHARPFFYTKTLIKSCVDSESGHASAGAAMQR